MKSDISHAVLDIESRKRKASAIMKILSDYKEIKNCRILNIGSGSGVIESEIGKISKDVYSVDIVDERIIKDNFVFKKVDDEKLPFKDNEFDIIISNHVMAHVRDNEAHLKEINRVLNKNGIVYLSMLNKLWPPEPNFNLLFLSWLPKKIADFYVKLSGKGKSYNVNPLTYNKFTKKISKYFTYEDITIKIIKRKFPMPHPVYRLFKMFSPIWILILKKVDG
ncbi:MAG: class I SAM-dependent methyltransferase [SAR202 cluster bacterium]|jgi:ubiquinone/menaquinone biosynthesis C-methylase UbiE|nr:class I SAM-dependent methyltransferase [SAR202 cluster bacterium]